MGCVCLASSGCRSSLWAMRGGVIARASAGYLHVVLSRCRLDGVDGCFGGPEWMQSACSGIHSSHSSDRHNFIK